MYVILRPFQIVDRFGIQKYQKIYNLKRKKWCVSRLVADPILMHGYSAEYPNKFGKTKVYT
jgi:hypothetical protein